MMPPDPGPYLLDVDAWLEAGAPFPPDSSTMLIARLPMAYPDPEPAPPRKAKTMPDVDASKPDPPQPVPAPPLPLPAPPKAQELQPDRFDVSALKTAIPEGLHGPEVLAFATIATVGAIAFRVLPKHLDGRHEEAMARIKQQGNHAPCAARIAELEARIAKSETLIGGGGLPSDVQERLERLEKAAKARNHRA